MLLRQDVLSALIEWIEEQPNRSFSYENRVFGLEPFVQISDWDGVGHHYRITTEGLYPPQIEGAIKALKRMRSKAG